MAADEVADVQFGHFIVGQVERRVTMLAQLLDELERFGARRNLDTDENVRRIGTVVAVVEFGDVAGTDQGEEFLVAAGFFRQRHGQHGLALLADLGAFGHKAQAVEIHVGAGSHRDQRLVLQFVPCGVSLGAGNGQRARGLED